MAKVRPFTKEDPREVQVREQIGALKARLRINDSDIARRTGISRSVVSQLIGAKGDIGKMRLRQLWQILDLDREGKS